MNPDHPANLNESAMEGYSQVTGFVLQRLVRRIPPDIDSLDHLDLDSSSAQIRADHPVCLVSRQLCRPLSNGGTSDPQRPSHCGLRSEILSSV